MHLDDQSEFSVFESFDHPAIPERSGTIETARGDSSRRARELFRVARSRQTRLAQVIVEVELRIVHPDRMALAGNSAELAPQARQISETGFDDLSDPLETNAAILGRKRAGVEDECHRGMASLSRTLALEIGGALIRQSLVMHACQNSLPARVCRVL